MSWTRARFLKGAFPWRREPSPRRSRFGRKPTIEELEGRQLLSAAPGRVHAAITPAATTTVPGTGGQFQRGLPFKDPQEFVSQNGILSITLHVQEQMVNVSGRRVLALVYNGTFAAPTLRLN